MSKKLDKKFILYSSVKSKLEQEFWLFISLTGRYNITISHKKKCGKIKTRKAKHKDTIDLFLERVERLINNYLLMRKVCFLME